MKNDSFEQRYTGCLLGCALGDALGYPVEFMKSEEILSAYGKRGITAPDVDKELGVALTAVDFEPQEGKLSADELEAVAGGGVCGCAVGGGGTAGENDHACACVFGGYGKSTERHERCLCALAGAGGSDD